MDGEELRDATLLSSQELSSPLANRRSRKDWYDQGIVSGDKPLLVPTEGCLTAKQHDIVPYDEASHSSHTKL
ncbi:hypothetical protein E8E14_004745 [Neopestalotiopsis sp. 37M]|nr:hypothetical protein E8E14_004745 [Neopestalotiopsis sp. 37M]